MTVTVTAVSSKVILDEGTPVELAAGESTVVSDAYFATLAPFIARGLLTAVQGALDAPPATIEQRVADLEDATPPGTSGPSVVNLVVSSATSSDPSGFTGSLLLPVGTTTDLLVNGAWAFGPGAPGAGQNVVVTNVIAPTFSAGSIVLSPSEGDGYTGIAICNAATDEAFFGYLGAEYTMSSGENLTLGIEGASGVWADSYGEGSDLSADPVTGEIVTAAGGIPYWVTFNLCVKVNGLAL